MDAFINGKISAVDSTDLTSTFYITDLNTDSEEWGAYSVGEKVDLDNDGENELIISGPSELVDPDNVETGMKYTWNGTAISYDEYTALCSKILAAEVNTNF